jgi:hypothetical protein
MLNDLTYIYADKISNVPVATGLSFSSGSKDSIPASGSSSAVMVAEIVSVSLLLNCLMHIHTLLEIRLDITSFLLEYGGTAILPEIK